jgi:flagellar motor switch protein FliG
MGVTTNMYYTLKELLPTTPIDFDYIKATILNNLKDNFEEVKDYQVKQKYMPLTVEQLKEIKEKGFTFVDMPDGSQRKITDQDILVSEKDAEKVLDHAKAEAKDDIIRPTIILPEGVQR